jgi:TRAP-type mannitol/chloroaromatic compound transport system permease small subunit
LGEVSYRRGGRSPNAGGMPWLFLPKLTIVIGFVLVTLEALHQALRAGRRLVFHYRATDRARHAA